MEEGEVSDSLWYIAIIATVLASTPIALEVHHTIFHRAHYTTPPSPRLPNVPLPPKRSPPYPPSSEISLSPNPTEGGATDGFV